MLIFCVPQNLVYRAVGENGKNVRSIGEILGRRIKIIPCPEGIDDLRDFIRNIVSHLEIGRASCRERV